jgi:hypothetical protein
MFKPALGWRKRRKIMKKSSAGGKGSSPRPFSVSQEEYDKRWDAIFGRDLKEESTEEVENEEDDDRLQCLRCGGVDTMYRPANGMYLICDQCGNTERIIDDDPDY